MKNYLLPALAALCITPAQAQWQFHVALGFIVDELEIEQNLTALSDYDFSGDQDLATQFISALGFNSDTAKSRGRSNTTSQLAFVELGASYRDWFTHLNLQTLMESDYVGTERVNPSFGEGASVSMNFDKEVIEWTLGYNLSEQFYLFVAINKEQLDYGILPPLQGDVRYVGVTRNDTFGVSIGAGYSFDFSYGQLKLQYVVSQRQHEQTSQSIWGMTVKPEDYLADYFLEISDTEVEALASSVAIGWQGELSQNWHDMLDFKYTHESQELDVDGNLVLNNLSSNSILVSTVGNKNTDLTSSVWSMGVQYRF